MKEMFIAFLIALVIGSIWNQMNGQDPGYAAVNGGDGNSNLQQPSGGNGQAIGSGSGISAEAEAGMSLVVDIDEGSFQGYVLDSREPTIVEFYTNNCQYCKKMAPILGQLAYNGQGVVRVCKINAEKSEALADRYRVADTGVPALVLFSEGHMLDSTAGYRGYEEMKSWLSQNNVTVPNTPSI